MLKLFLKPLVCARMVRDACLAGSLLTTSASRDPLVLRKCAALSRRIRAGVPKRQHLYFCLAVLGFFLAQKSYASCEVNVIGHVNTANSFSRHTTSFIECLHPDVNIKLFKTYKGSPQGFPSYFEKVLDNGFKLHDQKAISEFIKQKTSLKGITIYGDSVLWDGWQRYNVLPNNSAVKFAYCVTERTLVKKRGSIVERWVTKLNKHFDALLVPDEWLIETFKNVGIEIPIFVLPMALGLHSLLSRPIKKAPGKPFFFGFSGGCWPHKNHKLLIQAFAEEFGNDDRVVLKIHSRYPADFWKIVEDCKSTKAKNITLEQKSLTREEYEDFIASLHCYVTVSKGEGFSIIPREALAAGVPCIVSNNTAQTTICNSGCVYSVPANIIESSTWVLSNQSVGFDYNCSISDVKKALRTVYENYEQYREFALQGREWVQQYLPENLKQKYKALVSPDTVVLGDRNEITPERVITNSKKLFEKYKRLCGLKI